MGVAIAALTLIGCSDTWNDHYDAPAQGVSQSSLWKAIKDAPNLKNFASVVEATGYDQQLNSTQVFTVFAPTDDKFTQTQAQALINTYQAEKASGVRDEQNTVIKEFVKNHIALFNYSVSEGRSDSVMMLNGKPQLLTDKQFGGVDQTTTNALYENGVLFTVDGVVPYFPNVFEYLAKDADLDSVKNFFYNKKYFYYETFNANKSVPGEVIDGQTHYLDSIYDLNNLLFRYWKFINAELNEEDSTYWMVAPTNQTFETLLTKYSPYFNYDDKIITDLSPATKRSLDSLRYTNPRLAILQGTIFSRSTNSDKALNDSAMSTNAREFIYRLGAWGADTLHYYQFYNPKAAGGILNGTTDIACSNGQVMKATTWNVKPSETFMRDIILEAESGMAIDSLKTFNNKKGEKEEVCDFESVFIDNGNPYYHKVSRQGYVEFKPKTGQTVSVTFNLPYVLSNVPYDIYVRTAPALAGEIGNDTTVSDNERAPMKFRCQLSWRKADGTTELEPFMSEILTNRDSVDEILVKAGHKFEVCTYGVDEANCQGKLTIESRARTTEVEDGTATDVLRIDCILLKPREE